LHQDGWRPVMAAAHASWRKISPSGSPTACASRRSRGSLRGVGRRRTGDVVHTGGPVSRPDSQRDRGRLRAAIDGQLDAREITFRRRSSASAGASCASAPASSKVVGVCLPARSTLRSIAGQGPARRRRRGAGSAAAARRAAASGSSAGSAAPALTCSRRPAVSVGTGHNAERAGESQRDAHSGLS
jgi:hypothetical protein